LRPALLAALATLPDVQRAVVVLRYWERPSGRGRGAPAAAQARHGAVRRGPGAVHVAGVVEGGDPVNQEQDVRRMLEQAMLDQLHARLLAVLSKALPPDIKILEGSGPTDFRLERPDGTISNMSALEGLQFLGDPPEPCPKWGKDCQKVALPDGSRGWAYNAFGGNSSVVSLYTLNGQAFGLTDGDTDFVENDSHSPMETGKPLTIQQMITIVSRPDVLAVLKQVPTDQVH
jgi:hypothetical protein